MRYAELRNPLTWHTLSLAFLLLQFPPNRSQMKKKILIVDDNPDLISILQVLLKNKGYDTVQATNGMQAVDIATAQLPDLILMDIIMPVTDGFEATRLIRQNPKTSSIPILAVTALGVHKDRDGTGLWILAYQTGSLKTIHLRHHYVHHDKIR